MLPCRFCHPGQIDDIVCVLKIVNMLRLDGHFMDEGVGPVPVDLRHRQFHDMRSIAASGLLNRAARRAQMGLGLRRRLHYAPAMSLEPAIAMLKRTGLFAGIDAVRLEVMAFTCERREYAPGATLFEAGDEADCALLILDGEAAMLAYDAHGAAQALRLESGDLVGETALFEPQQRLTTVRAVSSLQVLRIGRDMFQRLMGEFPELAGAVAARLAARLSTLGDELVALGARLDEIRNETRKDRNFDE